MMFDSSASEIISANMDAWQQQRIHIKHDLESTMHPSRAVGKAAHVGIRIVLKRAY